MNSNKYYTGIIIRVILIALTALILAFVAYKTNYLYSILVLSVLMIAETWALIRYILRRRDDIKRMLEYIKENNPTLYFSQSRNYPFNELGYFLNEIGNIVRQVRIEKENQLQYMNYIIQHVKTGLLSFGTDGKVDLVNQAFKDLLGINEINTVDALDRIHTGLSGVLKKMKVNEQKVITLKSGLQLKQLAMMLSTFKIGTKEIRLVSFQDIKNELDEKEMEAWQKLIRVLTHEIINSVTPVTSLTSTISGFFKKNGHIVAVSDLSDETIGEALTGLGYIEDRGKNLIEFVTRFRSLTKLPAPKFEEVNLGRLTDAIALAKRDELSVNGIALKCNTSGNNGDLFCDRNLIEHVLLNLINNASDSLLANPDNKERLIEITSSSDDENHWVIAVKDNGPGIPDDILENIFIPFFTTKEQGSGIGLSLSRQIMKLHGGTISVYSKPGIETIFSLIF